MEVSLHQQRGFTLIELIIAMVVVAILAMVVFIRFPGKTANLDAQGELLADDIRYTQMLATTTGQRYRIVFNTANNSYQILNSTGVAILMPSGQINTTLSSGIVFYGISNLPNNLLNFDTRGVPYIDTSSPGANLTSQASITLMLNGTLKYIYVSPYTGRVTT